MSIEEATRELLRDACFREEPAAQYLGLSPRTLQGYRVTGHGPRFVRISRTAIRYRKADLDDWVRTRLRTSTSDPGPRPE